ncbi:MBOAT family O-acyltransferase [Aminipila luticellarii]|uniref:MBOAT family protein n=1 Tax=Aminipila luticellarii TaxID=2507160 RepID=A0A410PX71_9FIRM|nr:MBOAT family protein [Aminipila luticellarii]QAT43528.1 MBOAT family protein [Aminipila luticellarii]
MVFSSISFLIYFLPVVIGLYYLAPARSKNLVLLISSLFFYAWGEPVYVFLMIFSVIFNYCFGLLLDKSLSIKGRTAAANWIFAAGVAVNLGILGFFKYAGFLADNMNLAFGTHFSAADLPLPIGISFYTFQVMTYVIDLYRRKVKVQKNFLTFATYVTLFPQLISGPIVRYETIESQLVNRRVDMELFASGVRKFIIGMGKKMLLANNIGILWDSIAKMNPAELPAGTAWLGAVAFTLQIYFDFSGYSDMAIGLARMFGFTFLENFNYPYISKSITEFWRRWHISLGTWFREYVYIPLGGNRRGAGRQMLNIFIVWALTGLWHGASWNFVLWGMYFAVILVIEKLVLGKALRRFQERFPVIGSIAAGIYTMVLVTISWVIFAIEDLDSIGDYVVSLMGLHHTGFADSYTWYLLSSNFILLILCIIGSTDAPARLWKKFYEAKLQESPLAGAVVENAGLLILFIMSFAYIVASTYKTFIYFRF